MSIMAKTPSGYKKIGSAYLGERPVDKVFNANGDVVYALQRELTGVPPLLFKGKEQSELLNYRICGDSVDGESVGDRTGNLFDMKKFAELCYPRYASVTFADNTLSFTSTATDAYVNYVCDKGNTVGDIYRPSCIDVLPSTTYTISMSSIPKCYISWINSSFKAVSAYTRIPNNQSSYTFTTPEDCTKLLIRLGKEVNNIGDEFTIFNIMLNSGSTALPYEPYGYKVPVTVSNGTDTQTIPIYLPEQIRKIGDEAEYIDYGEQKQHRVRKNLLLNTATSQTIKGITFTVNSDGSIVCDGQASPSTATLIFSNFLVPSGTYILTGCPNGGSERATYKMLLFVNGAWLTNDMGSGANFTLTETSTVSARIDIYNGYTCNNLTFYPMIRKADIEDDTYEPYIENTELNVTLPALPTLTGTNVLTVGTEVQPSRMDIKGRIKSLT